MVPDNLEDEFKHILQTHVSSQINSYAHCLEHLPPWPYLQSSFASLRAVCVDGVDYPTLLHENICNDYLSQSAHSCPLQPIDLCVPVHDLQVEDSFVNIFEINWELKGFSAPSRVYLAGVALGLKLDLSHSGDDERLRRTMQQVRDLRLCELVSCKYATDDFASMTRLQLEGLNGRQWPFRDVVVRKDGGK